MHSELLKVSFSMPLFVGKHCNSKRFLFTRFVFIRIRRPFLFDDGSEMTISINCNLLEQCSEWFLIAQRGIVGKNVSLLAIKVPGEAMF